jgi:outer membrane protein insertion porin family
MGCLSLLFLASILSLYPISSIEVQGNQRLSSSLIVEILGFAPPCTLSESTISGSAQNVLARYLQEGFLDAKISHVVQEGTVTFSVFEGDQYRVGNISVVGNRFIKDEIFLRILGLRMESLFSAAAFEKGIEELLTFYGNNGFPFTTIIPVSFEAVAGTIALQLEIQEGPRLRWGKTTVQGNTITKSYVVEKQMRIPSGEYFSESKLQLAHAWLGKLSFIEPVGSASLLKGEKSGTVDLLVTVREIKSNRATGILGYVPPEDKERGGYVGALTTELLNLFGTGRSLGVSWEKQIPAYTRLNVTYTEPWILGTGARLQVILHHLLEDTLYTLSRVQIELQTDVSINLMLAVTSAWEKFSPATSELPSSKKYSVGTRVEIHALDYAMNPQKGILYRFYTEYGKKGSVNIMKFDLEMLNCIPLMSNHAVALLIAGQASRTNTPPLPEYEQFTLGGYRSLRGYRERQFRVTQMLRISPEYRFLLSRRSRVFIFYDSAFFRTATYPDNTTDDHFRYGYGVGAAFPAAIGILSLEYALGEEKTFMKGKIHLGLESTF